MKTLGKVALVIVLGLFGIMIVGAALSGGGEETGSSSPAPNEPRKQEQAQQQEPKPEPAKEKPKPKPEPTTYQVGDTVTVANVQWTVTDAYLTQQLKSTFGTQKRGNFVVVDFTFTNNRNEEVTLDPQLHMVLKDSRGREFGTDPDAWEFVPTNLDIFLQPVNPGISQDGRAIYQVPPDASGFTLTVDDVEFMQDKSATYDLGNLRAGSYSPASASATATATATATAGAQ